ncbi:MULTISPECIES: monovalent cation/H+ antiporter subunit D family protein [Halorubrum]|jgi:multicomponent Na+:H+ antiporter subunit D|uniref:monovalent cation/H+ antiporter subunit D family protein n=1 Tax=Halorubrum TaxID=56688 RepID=UPI0010F921BE|nr:MULTISPECIES: monovalent cation/H+ antiporter subunit D family protein [Halorubrum]MDB2236757.1 monovalent cation/H+ antiporter subunit D family protein [Halorubrum ezzemoulense]MDB2242327.1 monovalent cation/H+ antiporter subunit D family protein [Halorubrum ezzemoulense]MDB2247254.1 monovalent cation/H+ antiporter subunit D family protein [Halorubrum ezzemoulense]MDB2260849.1 monovalent cation/H+ antiporter subunit D family protein [Halorubrum ezzemoulense]MDB2267879.1 monovalent cation/H
MIDHLIVLLVVLPILGAAVPPLASLRYDRVGWAVATATALGHAALAGALAWTVWTDGVVRYAVGGFVAPYGIELVADGLTILLVALISAVSLGVLAYARHAGPHENSFYSQFLLLVAGLSGMTVTGDVFNLYVFLEITGLAAYGLVASGPGARSAVAALKYLIIGTIGASLYLLGVGYALAATGTLNMADLSDKLAAAGYDSTLVLTAFGLIVAGLLVKVALFPIHTWQPDAYADSPDSVSAFISALVSTVSAYALARVLFSVFTVDFLEAVPIARQALVAVACVSIVAGSALAVAQSDVQRMLAYSSVSQFGLVIAGFAIATPLAVVGATVHLVGHAVMKGGLFAATGIIERKTGATTVGGYAGIAGRAPAATGAFTLLALAMVGVPPAVGFMGKWYIVLGAVNAGSWPVVAVLLASTLLTLAYFARLAERLYFAEATIAPEAVAADGGERVSTAMIVTVVVAAVLAVGLAAAVPVIDQLIDMTVFELMLQ